MTLLEEVIAVRDDWSTDHMDRAWKAIELIARRLDDMAPAQRTDVSNGH